MKSEQLNYATDNTTIADANEIQQMFNKISKKYDILNQILSLNHDQYWRDTGLELINLKDGDRLLDIACGTGKIIGEASKKYKLGSSYGIDFSEQMINVAKKNYPKLNLVIADACFLPLPDKSFNKISIGYGFRNITQKQQALNEMYRVLEPSGMAAIIDFRIPKNILGQIYNVYFKKMLPKIASLLSDKSAYTYLPNSVEKYPESDEIIKMAKKSGFTYNRVIHLTIGVCEIIVLKKP